MTDENNITLTDYADASRHYKARFHKKRSISPVLTKENQKDLVEIDVVFGAKLSLRDLRVSDKQRTELRLYCRVWNHRGWANHPLQTKKRTSQNEGERLSVRYIQAICMQICSARLHQNTVIINNSIVKSQ